MNKTCTSCGEIKPATDFSVWRKQCKTCRAIYDKQRHLLHKEKRKDNYNRWYLTHVEWKKVYNKQYRQSHNEEIKNTTKKYRSAHKLEKLLLNKIRRRNKVGNGGKFTQKEWELLCAYYTPAGLCLSCREVWPLTIDHVIPVKLGGTSNIDNIQPLCNRCNIAKYVKHIDYRFDGGAFAKAMLLARETLWEIAAH